MWDILSLTNRCYTGYHKVCKFVNWIWTETMALEPLVHWSPSLSPEPWRQCCCKNQNFCTYDSRVVVRLQGSLSSSRTFLCLQDCFKALVRRLLSKVDARLQYPCLSPSFFWDRERFCLAERKASLTSLSRTIQQGPHLLRNNCTCNSIFPALYLNIAFCRKDFWTGNFVAKMFKKNISLLWQKC